MKNRINLSLTNFRNHNNINFSFPETGLVRIDGKSGVGKSSVFRAISYALFGKQNKITTWNEEKTEVSLSGFGLSVLRGKGPNILQVNNLNSSTAQNEIENILGMNKVEFDISSYVAQGQKNSLINLPPSEQMQLINELAFKGTDPFKQKEEIADKIKEVGSLLNQLEAKEENTSDKIKEISNTISSLKQTLFNVSTTETSAKKDFNNAERVLASIEEEIEKLSAERKKLIDNKNHPARSVVQPASEFLEKYPSSLKELKQKQASYKKRIEKINERAVEGEILEKTNLVKTLKSEHSKLLWLRSQIENLENHKEQKDISLQKINSIAEGLALYGEPEIVDKILGLKLNCENFLSHYDAVQSISVSNFEDEIKSKLEKLNKDIKSFEDHLSELHLALKDMQKNKVLFEENENEINILEKKYVKAQEIIEANKMLLPLPDLDEKIENIYNKTEELNSDLHKFSQIKNESQSILQQIARNKDIKSKISDYESKLKSTKEYLLKIQDEKETAKKLFSGCSEIAEVWQKSMLESLEGIIDDINFRATYWLDILLDGRVKARLKTTKKLKSKDKEISTINLELTCDGQVLESLNEDDLSGGQFSRLVLAFQLALSDMYNSPVLMLDESLQGCDAHTQEICIDAIKEISDRKLVIMVEHHTQDHFFDEVYYIE